MIAGAVFKFCVPSPSVTVYAVDSSIVDLPNCDLSSPPSPSWCSHISILLVEMMSAMKQQKPAEDVGGAGKRQGLRRRHWVEAKMTTPYGYRPYLSVLVVGSLHGSLHRRSKTTGTHGLDLKPIADEMWLKQQ
ncbi:uncharacterized protein LOC126783161 [Argentina anserina]|uniref:uncharacterized protein LOC126783161 n=1 Tax=Argentina anserina TaxID=57926 RepID=UPI0021765C45|nr:uncharacterized protein LOC126783161 [Potentilla anserina]